MSSLNSCNFIGHVGKPPEFRALQNGKEVATFSLACSERWRTKDGESKEKTTWIPICVFNEALVTLTKKYITKGSKIYVSGAFEVRTWQDKDGATKYTTEIVLAAFNGKIVLLSAKEEQPSQNNHDKAKTNAYAPADLGDEIPW